MPKTPSPHVVDDRCGKPSMRFVEGTRNSLCESCGRIWNSKGIVLADPKFAVDARSNAKVVALVKKAEAVTEKPADHKCNPFVRQSNRKFNTMRAADRFLIGRRDAVTAAFKDNGKITIDAIEVIRIFVGEFPFRLVAFPTFKDVKIPKFDEPDPQGVREEE